MDSGFGKGRGEGNSHRADAHCSEENEYPLRDVLHKDSNPVTALDAFSHQFCGNAGSLSEHIRIAKLRDVVLMIDSEGKSVRIPLRPFFDTIEDPVGRRGLG